MLELEPEYIVPDYVSMSWPDGVGQNEVRQYRMECPDDGEDDCEISEMMVQAMKMIVKCQRTDILGDISPDKLELALKELVADGRKPRAVMGIIS